MGIEQLFSLSQSSSGTKYDSHANAFFRQPSYPTPLPDKIASLCAIVDIRRLLGLSSWTKNEALTVEQGVAWSAAMGQLVAALQRTQHFQSREDAKVMATNLLKYLSADSKYSFLYTFRLNPQKITYNRKKLVTVNNYGHGKHDLQHFGEDLITLDLSLSTGTMLPPKEILDMGIDNPLISSAYLKFKEFESFTESCRQKMMFVLVGEVYMGHINHISYTREGTSMPREILFNLNISVQPHVKFFISDILGSWKEFFAKRDLMWGDFLDTKDTLTHTSSQSYRGTINAAQAGIGDL